jgi:hypothetical protein
MRIAEEITLSQARLRNGTHPIIVIDSTGEYNFYNLKGKHSSNKECNLDLIMYEEIEVKEPSEVFVVETLNGEIVCTLRTIKEAENIIYNLSLTKNLHYKIVKFIEVIEESE